MQKSPPPPLLIQIFYVFYFFIQNIRTFQRFSGTYSSLTYNLLQKYFYSLKWKYGIWICFIIFQISSLMMLLFLSRPFISSRNVDHSAGGTALRVGLFKRLIYGNNKSCDILWKTFHMYVSFSRKLLKRLKNLVLFSYAGLDTF